MKKILILFFIILNGCANYNTESKINIREKQRNEDIVTCKHYGFKRDTLEFSNCLMKLDQKRNEILITRKILQCQNVRRDNANSDVTGFWGGVLMGLRENLACD